jgi:hypothetical protein
MVGKCLKCTSIQWIWKVHVRAVMDIITLSIPKRQTRIVNNGELARHFSLKNFE